MNTIVTESARLLHEQDLRLRSQAAQLAELGHELRVTRAALALRDAQIERLLPPAAFSVRRRSAA